MSGPTLKDLEKLSDGATISGLLPYLEREIATMNTALEARVMRALDDRTLTPDAALLAWQEKAAFTRLLKRFQTRVLVGQAAGSRAKPYLDITTPHEGE